MLDSNHWKRCLVTLKGAKLLSRPDMETREVKGFETPQRFGRAMFQVEGEDGKVITIRIGAHYWDVAVSQFANIQGDTVDVVFLRYPWSVCGHSGIAHYFYEIKETPN